MAANQSEVGRHWSPADRNEDGQPEVDSVDVNLGETDPKRAIRRNAAEAKPPEDASDDRNDPLMKSRAVRQRLTRLRRGFKQQLADRDALHQRQLADLQSKVDKLSITREAPVTDADYEAKAKLLQDQIEAAHEKGDSKAVAELTRKLTKLDADHAQAQTIALLGGNTREQPAARRQQESVDDTATRAVASKQPPKARIAWLRGNDEWYDDPEYAGEKGYVDALWVRALNDGEEETPELFARISRQAKKLFPNLEIDPIVSERRRARDDEDEDEEDDEDSVSARRNDRREARRAPVRGAAEDRGEDFSARGSTKLTSDDLRNMRAFGMDTDDPKALQSYALEKQAERR